MTLWEHVCRSVNGKISNDQMENVLVLTVSTLRASDTKLSHFGDSNVKYRRQGTDVLSDVSGRASKVQSQSLRRPRQQKNLRRTTQRQTSAASPVSSLQSLPTALPWWRFRLSAVSTQPTNKEPPADADAKCGIYNEIQFRNTTNSQASLQEVFQLITNARWQYDKYFLASVIYVVLKLEC